MVRRVEPREGQTWRTFIRNHSKQVFECDFLTQYTALFAVVHVFVVMEIASRRIVLVNATTSPSLAWVKRSGRAWPRIFSFTTTMGSSVNTGSGNVAARRTIATVAISTSGSPT